MVAADDAREECLQVVWKLDPPTSFSTPCSCLAGNARVLEVRAFRPVLSGAAGHVITDPVLSAASFAGDARVLEGHAFIVEAAVSVGGQGMKQGINVHRFANRIPLLFEVELGIPHLPGRTELHQPACVWPPGQE